MSVYYWLFFQQNANMLTNDICVFMWSPSLKSLISNLIYKLPFCCTNLIVRLFNSHSDREMMVNTHQTLGLGLGLGLVWVVYVYLVALTKLKYGFDVLINSFTSQKKGRMHTWHVVICASDTEHVVIDAVEEALPYAFCLFPLQQWYSRLSLLNLLLMKSRDKNCKLSLTDSPVFICLSSLL